MSDLGVLVSQLVGGLQESIEAMSAGVQDVLLRIRSAAALA